VALNGDIITSLRPYPALSYVRWWEYNGESNYHALQATLSRQTGRRLQYFFAYTFSKVLGTSYANGEYDDVDPFEPEERSYGVLRYDRTHIFSASYNYLFPDPIKKGGVLGAFLNGWQLSGITTWSSGIPYSIGFGGEIAGAVENAWWGTPDHYPFRIQNAGGAGGNAASVAPTMSCNPAMDGRDVGEKIANINCLGFPSFGTSGPHAAPYYLRFPSRMNWDLSVFKNFNIGQGGKKIQFRAGFFNIFNQAAPGSSTGQDIDLNLETRCNVRANGVPNGTGGTSDNVCDPTQGFTFTENTISNFGKIILQRGKRVVEFALKFYF
jgi:hypothetical protein